jgi:general secretion pathway protein D
MKRLLLIALLLFSPYLIAEDRNDIRLNEVPLSLVVNIVEDITKYDFVLHPSAQNIKVNAYIRSTDNPNQVYEYLLSLLKVNNLQTYEENEQIQIVPIERKKSLIRPSTIPKSLTPETKAKEPPKPINLRVVSLRNANPEELIETMSGLLPGISFKQDIETHSLIIAGDDQTTIDKAIQTIRQLDQPRKQVLVEAIIAEISNDQAKEMGVAFNYDGYSNDQSGTFIGANNKGTGNILDILASPTLHTGLLFGLGGGGSSPFSLLFRALNNDAQTKILSTPSLVTANNKKAYIVVGQNVPFVTGQYTSTANASNPENPFQTIERKDIGIKFDVTPRISYNNTINLEINQEVSTVANSAQAADIITNKREIKTNVNLQDGQILVLGGLIQNANRHTKESVPYLSDIPVIGNAFKYNNQTNDQSNLVVFIRAQTIKPGQNPTHNKLAQTTKQFPQIKKTAFKKAKLVEPDLFNDEYEW